MISKTNLLPVFAFATLSIVPSGATVIIADSLIGSSGSGLNGTNATTFSPAIISAGGSDSWEAGANFKANGSVSSGGGNSAGLALGDYVNNTRGNANGLFTLTATISAVTGGTTNATWLTVNFMSPENGTAFDPNVAIFIDDNQGVGIGIRRAVAGTTFFNFTPSGNGAVTTDWATQTADVTFTVELDLRDWNGTDNYGSLAFFRNGVTTAEHEVELTKTYDITHLGFGSNGGAIGTISNFSVSQIPEPSSSLLALLSGVAMLRRRR